MHIKNKSQDRKVLTFDNYVKIIDFRAFTLFHFWFLSCKNSKPITLINKEPIALVHFLYLFLDRETTKPFPRDFPFFTGLIAMNKIWHPIRFLLQKNSRQQKSQCSHTGFPIF